MLYTFTQIILTYPSLCENKFVCCFFFIFYNVFESHFNTSLIFLFQFMVSTFSSVGKKTLVLACVSNLTLRVM